MRRIIKNELKEERIEKVSESYDRVLKDDYDYVSEIIDSALQNGTLNERDFNKMYDEANYRADDMYADDIVEELMAMRDHLDILKTAIRYKAYYDMLKLK